MTSTPSREAVAVLAEAHPVLVKYGLETMGGDPLDNLDRHLTANCEATIGAIKLRLQSQPSNQPQDSLDTAWAAAEAALEAWAPSSRFVSVELSVFRDLTDAGEQLAYTAMAGRVEHREPNGPPARGAEIEATGPTPAAALNALASALRSETKEGDK